MDLSRKITFLFCLFLCSFFSPVARSQDVTTESNTSPTAETSSMTSSTEPPMTSSSEPMTSETTSEPQTTTPTIPIPSRNHYVAKDGNITCLVMDATFVLRVSYLHRLGQMMVKVFSVPENATSTGQCTSNQTEVLDISFFNKPRQWKLHIDVEREQNDVENDLLLAEENVKYYWKEITLTYYLDKEHFPDAERISDNPWTVTTANTTHLFEATNEGSYKCIAQQNVRIEGVNLEVSNFQYRAFGETTKDDYPKTGLQECSADKKDDDDDDTGKIVGIVVGSVVGGLILLTIIGCFIQKARKRGSYEKV